MDILNTAEYALEALTKAGADKAACKIVRARKEELNVEAGKFSLMRTIFDDGLNLKAICGGRKGVAVINKLDKESIDRAADECIRLAKSATPDDAEDVAEKLENKSFNSNIGGPDIDTLFGRTKELLELVGDEYPRIVLEGLVTEFNSAQTVYINSKGVEFRNEHENYQFSSMFSAKDGEKSSSFNGYGAVLNSLSKPFIDVGMHRTLLEEAVRSTDTRLVDGKFVGKVILTPACADMIWYTLYGCFLADGPLIDGTSRWKDALGTVVADPKLTMRAAPLHPAIIGGERFTADGYESKNADIICDGILKSFALSLYGSRKTNRPRAANTGFYSVEVAAGDTPLADMIKSVDRGILLNRFSGGAPGPSGEITGVAKNSFLIENGHVTDALSETMLSFNILDILMKIPAISKERCEDGASVLPWCCFDGVTISGK